MAEEVVSMDMMSMDAFAPPPPRTSPYEFDLVVIGGGSGGLACARQAVGYGAKVAVIDYVVPTPRGTTWDIGGTCVNVGCIPKKMMHFAGLFGDMYRDYQSAGWNLPEKSHDWAKMVAGVQKNIKKMTWGYTIDLMTKGIETINLLAKFKDDHTLNLYEGNVEEPKKTITSEHIVIAVGGRPSYGGIEGAEECTFTSDDIFSMADVPDHVCIVGASYIALESAGMLRSCGKQVTVMVRSIFLRGFDQQMADKVAENLASIGVQFIRGASPTKFEKTENGVKVTYQQDDQELTAEFPGVMMAVGRNGLGKTLNLDAAGVEMNVNGKIPVNAADATNVPHIHAIGDIQLGRLELTPSAIKSGNLLAERLFNNSNKMMDYTNVPTTIFTPLEYSTCGYTEEEALEKFGKDALKIYNSEYQPLEWQYLEERKNETIYGKIIINTQDSNRVIGLHYVGPNAGELMQGFAVAIKAGATYEMFADTCGIHPTTAEEFVYMDREKVEGVSALKTGC